MTVTKREAWAAMVLGITVSIAANVLAAEPTWPSRAINAWAPIVFAIAVHIAIGTKPRTPAVRRVVRTGLTLIGAIAAWASYGHMIEVVQTLGGEHGPVSWFLPLTVDALVALCLAIIWDTETSTRARKPPPPQRARVDPQPAKPAASNDKAASNTERAAKLRAVVDQHPDWTQQQIANEVGCSPRTVRRYLSQTSTNGATP